MLHHRQINPEKMFAPVFGVEIPADMVIPENSELITLVANLFAEDADRTEMRENLSRHIGGACRTQLRQGLAFIVAVLSSPAEMNRLHLSLFVRDMLLYRLIEGVSNCTPGFINRVQEILLEFKNPQSLEELLSEYRRHLVGQAFRRDEQRMESPEIYHVHTYNRFFVVANALGYGVPCVAGDIHRGSKDDDDIENALKAEFSAWYTPLHITSQVLDQPLQTMLEEKEYDNGQGPWEFICDFLKKILNNNSLSYYDIFKVSGDWQHEVVEGLDRIKIRSHLIDLMFREGYFHFDPTLSEKISIRENGLLEILYEKNDFKNALIRYTDQGVTLQSHLFADQNIAALLPEASRQALAGMVKQRLVKKFLSRKNLLFYLTGINNTFAGRIPDGLFSSVRKKAGYFIRSPDDFAEAFGPTLSEGQFEVLFDVFHLESILSGVVQTLPHLAWLMDMMPRGKLQALLRFEITVQLIAAHAHSPLFFPDILGCFPRWNQGLRIIESEAARMALLDNIRTWDQLRVYLEPLYSGHIRMLLETETLDHILWNIDWTPADAADLMRFLGRCKFNAIRFIPAIRAIIAVHINTADELYALIKLSHKSHRPDVLRAFLDRLPTIIRSMQDLCNILKHLAPGCRAEAMRAAKSCAPVLVRSYEDIKILAFYDIQGDALREWIGTRARFLHLLEGCPRAKRKNFLGRLFRDYETLADEFRMRVGDFSVVIAAPAFFQRPAALMAQIYGVDDVTAMRIILDFVAAYPNSPSAHILGIILENNMPVQNHNPEPGADVLYYAAV